MRIRVICPLCHNSFLYQVDESQTLEESDFLEETQPMPRVPEWEP